MHVCAQSLNLILELFIPDLVVLYLRILLVLQCLECLYHVVQVFDLFHLLLTKLCHILALYLLALQLLLRVEIDDLHVSQLSLQSFQFLRQIGHHLLMLDCVVFILAPVLVLHFLQLFLVLDVLCPELLHCIVFHLGLVRQKFDFLLEGLYLDLFLKQLIPDALGLLTKFTWLLMGF